MNLEKRRKPELIAEIKRKQRVFEQLREQLAQAHRDRFMLEDLLEEANKTIAAYQQWFKDREYISKRNEPEEGA